MFHGPVPSLAFPPSSPGTGSGSGPATGGRHHRRPSQLALPTVADERASTRPEHAKRGSPSKDKDASSGVGGGSGDGSASARPHSRHSLFRPMQHDDDIAE